jgi:hypothetical protein
MQDIAVQFELQLLFIPVQCVEYDIQKAPIKEKEEYNASG